ncbi:AppC [Desulforapulum autotrophicum HRM2]|uniref:AppC n=1 Tax=Desulforapulum autotrophicum (strain ATCC 43914 / DSM 3382 / VKM B-1955 / HRM2) TaxID=177437 RepID=C0Q8R3_DESAH|nr:ABC transporter permease [Desulforapulum autotrophicum]ACN14403.1 AppC [Desulforapulum autotrophicum HRM2]
MTAVRTQALPGPDFNKGLGLDVIFPSPGQIMRQRMTTHKGFIIGGLMILTVFAAALFAPYISHHDPYEQNLSQRMIPPVWAERGTWDHPLGTDSMGREYLCRLVYGARISILIGLACMSIAAVIGISLGLAAGYFGGTIDMIVSFIITVRLALPAVLVAVAVVALIGGSMTVVIMVLGCLIWDRFAVVMRATTQQIRSMDYVQAARAAGCSVPWLLIREIMPNLLNSIVIVATLEIGRAILLEAALSFLGMGVQPPTPSWGLMISEGKDMMLFSPYLVTIPGVALFFMVLGMNLFGDGLRDVTSPEGRS